LPITDSLAMNCLKNYLTPFVIGIIVLSLNSCASSPTNRQSDNPNLPTAETAQTPSTTFLSDSGVSIPAQPEKETPVANPSSQVTSSTTPAKDTVTLTIYQADSQCQTLVSEKVAVPTSSPVDAAVGKVLNQADSGDFDIAGYRVQVNPKNGIATVDFRLSPNSRRQFVSLSTCEQFALFGSLRKTLTDNSPLKIKGVRFTERGQDIVL
jgi:hypothetical protein